WEHEDGDEDERQAAGEEGLADVQLAPWERYLELWRVLLLLPPSPDLWNVGTKRGGRGGSGLPPTVQADLDRNYGPAVQRQLRVAMYDTLMAAVLDTIRNLDLSYSPADGDGPGAGMCSASRDANTGHGGRDGVAGDASNVGANNGGILA
ncbi:hypothetical protein Agub_g6692, partial [Astrephomene gubernaculifera]